MFTASPGARPGHWCFGPASGCHRSRSPQPATPRSRSGSSPARTRRRPRPVVVVGSSRDLKVTIYPGGAGPPAPLIQGLTLPEFGATHEAAFLVPGPGLQAGQVFYARFQASDAGADRVYFVAATLERELARGARHALMISLACGALAALALATAAMWFVLSDRLFILYAAMTGLQALYLAYFSG